MSHGVERGFLIQKIYKFNQELLAVGDHLLLCLRLSMLSHFHPVLAEEAEAFEEAVMLLLGPLAFCWFRGC